MEAHDWSRTRSNQVDLLQLLLLLPPKVLLLAGTVTSVPAKQKTGQIDKKRTRLTLLWHVESETLSPDHNHSPSSDYRHEISHFFWLSTSVTIGAPRIRRVAGYSSWGKNWQRWHRSNSEAMHCACFPHSAIGWRKLVPMGGQGACRETSIRSPYAPPRITGSIEAQKIRSIRNRRADTMRRQAEGHTCPYPSTRDTVRDTRNQTEPKFYEK